MRAAAVPLHRGTRVIPPFGVYRLHDFLRRTAFLQILLVHVYRLDIPILVDRLEPNIGHTDFLALVDIRRPLQRMQQRGQHFGRYVTVLTIIAESR
ncbi:hypothetical protein D3C81_1835530 [compost metagenome]